MKYFSRHIQQKKIFPSKEGQNWQLILPLAYQFKYGYIHEPLCTCVIRQNSHSRIDRSLKKAVEKYNGFIDILTETIKPLNIPNKKELLNFIWANNMHIILILGINHGDANLIYDCCRRAQERNLNIFGNDNFDVGFLLAKYILPRIELQKNLTATKDKLKKIIEEIGA